MVFNMFHCFFHYMVQPKVIMPPWWKDMGFKKKNCVPREKSGRHSNLIYLVLNPPKKIRDGIQWFFIIFKMLFIIFQVIYHHFQGGFHYFSLIFQCCYMCFIIFHCLLGICFLQFTCIFCIFAVPYTWKTQDGRKCIKILGVFGFSGLNKWG